MNAKSLMSGEALIEIERSRYDQLLAKEERLNLLVKAIHNTNSYDFSTIKAIFEIKEDKK